MQHLERGRRAVEAYHAYLQKDHDFRVWAEILNLEEREVDEVDILDGQVNLASGDDGPDRTASIVLSDPEGARDFGLSYAEDPKGVLWVNRLVRIKHQVDIPSGVAAGLWTTTVMVGVPTAAARQGAEVSLELGDKSLLADHGVKPRTYKKGANVERVLRSILADLTGERHFRIPKTKKRLSRPYTVGMGEDALTPWQAFKRIAGAEMGWRAFYSSDGFATCEPTRASKRAVQVEFLLNLPDASATFTDFINYVKVTSNRKLKNKRRPKAKNDKTAPAQPERTVHFEGVVALPAKHRLSHNQLNRNGVPRYLPLVVDNDNLKTGKAVMGFASDLLRRGSKVDDEDAFEIMPIFHLDKGDRFHLPLGIGRVAFDDCSIPLGTGGNMTLGQVKWVSRTVRIRRVRSKRTVHVKRQKGGKRTNGRDRTPHRG
jgi:hypothetical protein